MAGILPQKGVAFMLYMSVISRLGRNIFQTTPTIAPGDFQVSIDGGAFNNLITLPIVSPAADKQIEVAISTAEMDGDQITVIGSDVAGAEWFDAIAFITPFTGASFAKGEAYTFYLCVLSRLDRNIFQTAPTIAPGDFRVSIDGGAFNNLATLPVVSPAGSKQIEVALSAAEMNGDMISVIGSDAAGDEWVDILNQIFTRDMAAGPGSVIGSDG